MFRINTKPLERLERRYSSPAVHRIGAARAGAEHVTLIQSAFDQGGPPGHRWAPKAVPRRTAANKRGPKRRFDPTPRLQSTGALVASINARPDERGYEIGPGNLPYAAIHQFGGTINVTPRMRGALRAMGFFLRKTTNVVRIPARPYIVLPAEWEAIIVEAYLSAKLSEANTDGA